MPKAFLVAGSTGAGKTTYSRLLAQKHQAQLFSLDEWMQSLFWMDAPPGADLNWALDRVRRCENQIWLLACRLLSSGQSVILDLGFAKRDQRDRFRSLVQSIGCEFELHFLHPPIEIRRERVRKRNSEKSGTFQFEVDDTTFEWFESYFEPPTLEELQSAMVVRNESVEATG